ncbi:MAG: DUF4065 domain-containing protein [Bacillaceae bacterium]|nr:DUF4065 domain-containing protein [Bacillaceae bacterium]
MEQTVEKFCPECMDYTICDPFYDDKEYQVRGEVITVKSHFLKCRSCGEVIPDKVLQDKNLEAVYTEFRRRKNLLQPREIEDIRKKYDVSQRQLARILGWSHATLSRYENGVVQSVSHNNELVLLKDPCNMLSLLENNKENIPENEHAAILKKVRSVIEEEQTKTLKNLLLSVVKFEEPNIYNGYRTLDLDKLANTIKYFASKDHQLWKVKLMKYLFYTDFLNFKRYTTSINGLKYVHLPMGPVPDRYDELLLILLNDETGINREYVTFSEGAGERFSTSTQFDPSMFTPEELDTMSTVFRFISPHSSSSISDRSHQEDAWLKTKEKEWISYEFATTLSID